MNHNNPDRSIQNQRAITGQVTGRVLGGLILTALSFASCVQQGTTTTIGGDTDTSSTAAGAFNGTLPGLSKWSKGSGVNVTENGATATVTTTGAAWLNTKVPYKTGRVLFNATLRGTGTVQLFLQKAGGDWGQYASQNVTLKSTDQLVSVAFNKPSSDGFDLQVGIARLDPGDTVRSEERRVGKEC